MLDKFILEGNGNNKIIKISDSSNEIILSCSAKEIDRKNFEKSIFVSDIFVNNNFNNSIGLKIICYFALREGRILDKTTFLLDKDELNLNKKYSHNIKYALLDLYNSFDKDIQDFIRQNFIDERRCCKSLT